MKISAFATAALLGGVVAAPFEARAQLQTDALVADGVLKLGQYLATQPKQKCTMKNVAVRKEW
jgi:tyrosinase